MNGKSGGEVVVASNPKARRNFAIEETVEAGLSLVGTEVKSLREATAAISEAFVRAEEKAAWLVKAHIPAYRNASPLHNHRPDRARRLLVTKRQLKKWIGKTSERGMSLVPLDIHFNGRGIAKLSVGLGRGIKKYDKRQLLKQREWQSRRRKLMGRG